MGFLLEALLYFLPDQQEISQFCAIYGMNGFGFDGAANVLHPVISGVQRGIGNRRSAFPPEALCGGNSELSHKSLIEVELRFIDVVHLNVGGTC